MKKYVVRGTNSKSIVTDVTDDEVLIAQKEREEETLVQPYKKWVRNMAVLDNFMPRFLEDHITYSHGGIADNEFMQAKYDEKIAMRDLKPIN